MIAELTQDDMAAAVALWEAAGLTRPWNDPAADYTRALAGPTSTVLGLWDGGTLAGTAMVGHDGHRGWVYYLAVDPGRQGHGLGRDLMAACESWLVARAVPKIQFMVRTTNTPVLDFYAHLGYDQQECFVLGRRLDGVSMTEG